MTRVLRYAALLLAAGGLSGCVFVPALVPSDDSSTSPAKTATTRSPDVTIARTALAAAVTRLSVVNEGGYTLWLSSTEKGEKESTYFVRTTTQYDLSRGMIDAEIDAVDGSASVRILKSKGVFVRPTEEGDKAGCWYHLSLKEFNALPGVPFAYDLEADSALSTLLDQGDALSIKPDPDYPAARIVRVRSSIRNALRVAMPGISGEFADDLKDLKGAMNVDVQMFGNEVTFVSFDLVPVLGALEGIGLGHALPEIMELKRDKPVAELQLEDMKESFEVKVPANVCPAGDPRPRLSDA